MIRFSFFALAVCLLLSLPHNAAAGNSPNMEKGKELLETALSEIKQPSTSKDTIISTLKSAREAINQAPGLYRGHRVKAIEFIDEAITQANNGSEQNKTYSYIRKAIVEVNAGIQLAR